MSASDKSIATTDTEQSRSKASSMTDLDMATTSDVLQDGDSSASTENGGNKAKLILSILRQFIGVKDMASVRFSLPAQLIEPVPNLEYWNYLDRPDYFLCINDSDDPIERMMSLLRWYLTKDLKLVHGKICKPYNSVLGEFFRCTWNTSSIPTSSLSSSMLDYVSAETSPVPKSTSRFKPNFGRKTTTTTAGSQTSTSVPTTRSTSPTPSTKSNNSTSGADVHVTLAKPIRTAFLCEQTCHHPPVSAYIYSCPEKNIEAYGMDQIASKFTGTTIKVSPGEQNLGIFVKLTDRDEEYQCTHPTASICGLLRGSLYAAVQDTSVIQCEKTRLKAILWYKDEPWIGKPKYALEGIVFRYNPKGPSKMNDIKDVPEDAIIARIEGCWKNKIYISNPKSKDKHLLIDVSDLRPHEKTVPAPHQQKPNESRAVWEPVTRTILAKQFESATRRKTEIEDEQRRLAKEREEKNAPFEPTFFRVKEDGRPELTQVGKVAIQGQLSETWHL